MMILRDTQVAWIEYTKQSKVTEVYDYLAAAGINICNPDSNYLECYSHNPVIKILAFDSIQQIEDTIHHAFHSNVESVVYLVAERSLNADVLHELPIIFAQDGAEHLIDRLVHEEQKIMQRNLFVHPATQADMCEKFNFYGRSSAFVEMAETIGHYAKHDESVFIRGETGTGKELIARSIHYLSDRCNAPFVPINCGAFSDELILGELFGYEKGAFTGAMKSRKGLLEIADNGTVFLDEVDSLSQMAQVALLRYLQDAEVRPVGSNKIKKVNVRVLAASNQNIGELVSAHKFREDLLYRLDVLTLEVPALRARHEDLHLLSQYFLARMANESCAGVKVFSRQVLADMENHGWPGNIRELENFVKRMYVTNEGKVIEKSCLTVTGDMGERIWGKLTKPYHYISSFKEEKAAIICDFERDYLHQVLSRTRGNISKAATLAKKERRAFCRLMKKHGLVRQSYVKNIGNTDRSKL